MPLIAVGILTHLGFTTFLYRKNREKERPRFCRPRTVSFGYIYYSRKEKNRNSEILPLGIALRVRIGYNESGKACPTDGSSGENAMERRDGGLAVAIF